MPTLPEELLLLALRDKEGTVPYLAAQSLEFGLSAAALLELALGGGLQLFDQRKVGVSVGARTGDDILDEVMVVIGYSKQGRSMAYWVRSLNNGYIKDMKGRLLRRLVQRGVLREEGRRYLGVINRQRYLPVDAVPEQQLRDRIRNVVLAGSTPDARVFALISLLRVCNLVAEVFPENERERARRRIEEIRKDRLLSAVVPNGFRQVCAEAASAVTSAIAASVSV